MRIFRLGFIFLFLNTQGFCEGLGDILRENDLSFRQESGQSLSAEAWARSFGKIYSLTWQDQQSVSAKLMACEEQNLFETSNAIEMPQLYQGGLRISQPLEEREELILGADLLLDGSMEPGLNLSTVYQFDKTLFLKADYSLEDTHKLRMGLGIRSGNFQIEYLFFKDDDAHRIGLVTRLG